MAELEKCLTGLHFGRCRKREQQEFRRILGRWNWKTESGLAIDWFSPQSRSSSILVEGVRGMERESLGSFWMMSMKNLRREGEEEEYTSCRCRVSLQKRGNVAFYWS
jgi:hypothetical protein